MKKLKMVTLGLRNLIVCMLMPRYVHCMQKLLGIPEKTCTQIFFQILLFPKSMKDIICKFGIHKIAVYIICKRTLCTQKNVQPNFYFASPTIVGKEWETLDILIVLSIFRRRYRAKLCA